MMKEADRFCKDIDDMLDEMGELPDKTEENKRRLDVIESKLKQLGY